MTKEEAYVYIINDAFSVNVNCNDFFAYACAWSLELDSSDIKWIAEFISKVDHESEISVAHNACLAYIANREPIKPWVNESFLKYIEMLKELDPVVYSDFDYSDGFLEDGPYRKLDKEGERW